MVYSSALSSLLFIGPRHIRPLGLVTFFRWISWRSVTCRLYFCWVAPGIFRKWMFLWLTLSFPVSMALWRCKEGADTFLNVMLSGKFVLSSTLFIWVCFGWPVCRWSMYHSSQISLANRDWLRVSENFCWRLSAKLFSHSTSWFDALHAAGISWSAFGIRPLAAVVLPESLRLGKGVYVSY